MPNLNQEDILERPRRGVDPDCLFHAAEKAVRRDTLLEHWPKRKSSIVSFDSEEVEIDDTISMRNKRQMIRRSVHFSETSLLFAYERESMYILRSLTYTKKDYDKFSKDALLEGLRIKSLITAAPHDSDASSIKYLLRQGIISREEVIGIEHFILGKPSRVPKIRKQHAVAVLWKQQEQQQQQQQRQKIEDPALSLGKFAQSSSRRSMQRARIRAAMAA
mmetsp:Transcript_19833/g.28245  ORF Transcript_19833/g.28245 Transcript_19833/m.28245 type:complete len:219 (+) Transcript_19833:94-750(+)|eukprot:CAMPEP_0201696964 /NCGR_PEP_ID=MMETSP0578-20130828/8861_1 /ASSEMBLY_ACC=CAM_ASM_000663 /TAXON_ID=267565 /ORGANISM="Skeletonema grethea, Strain CCMP 1804" /LENGTH=218 /DNA_ID=CAMNT_0048183005 /DNA_START=84 /DNA_END=740 /DNA_ORIENTATION=+